MIDVNKIRSMKVLETIREDINTFLNHNQADLMAVYDGEGEGEDDLVADREAAQDLLSKVERRIKSLGNHLIMATKDVQAETHSQKTASCSSVT